MDEGRKQTDKLLSEMEKKIAKEYKQAEKEVEEKLNAYLERFAVKDEQKRQAVKSGEITQKEYNDWRKGQIMIGQRWTEMKNTLAEDYHNANLIARSTIYGYMPEVYALNHNYGTFEVESQSQIDTSYTLYDRQTVERLMRDNPDLLPPVGKKLAQRIAAGQDVLWNKQLIQSVMTQSILQGESIDKIAKRLSKQVGDTNKAASIRNARTMTTSAENAGRVNSYKRAQDMGINLTQQWIATLDGRTRDSHRYMDGETVKVGGVFSNGLRYPADPEGRPSEVWNCRCTLICQLKGFQIDASDLGLRRSEKLNGMSYDEWKNGHQKPLNNPNNRIKAPLDIGDNPNKDKIKDWYFKQAIDNKGGIEYIPVERLEKPLTIEQIIDKIGGSDLTDGSCLSLAYAYAANLGGWDVNDFRGGDSREVFGKQSILGKIADLEGVESYIKETRFQIEAFNNYVKDRIKEGEEYILQINTHASIVKREEGVVQWLELQEDKKTNGWRVLDDDVLQWRFHAEERTEYPEDIFLVNVNGLKDNEEFISMLGYLNTPKNRQMEGTGGYAK